MLSGGAATEQADAIGSAARWVEGALMGSVATAIAILAIAGIGFLMLTGRVDIRRGATVVVGCFILFGASTIASALQSVATGDAAVEAATAAPVAGVIPSPSAPPPVPAMSDPYAGASVPRNR